MSVLGRTLLLGLIVADAVAEADRNSRNLNRDNSRDRDDRTRRSTAITNYEFGVLLSDVRRAKFGYELAPIKAKINDGCMFTARQVGDLMDVLTVSEREKLLPAIFSSVEDQRNLSRELRSFNFNRDMCRKYNL